MTHSEVTIQITPKSFPSTPSWMGEVVVFAQMLTHTGILKTIQEQVRFARARFGHYDLIDFVVVLIGYAVSGEPTLLAFYERLAPFAEPFMALFGRNQLLHRSALSRFLAALDQSTVEALRTRFQEDLLARKPFASPGGLFDRTGEQWMVVDVDGTRQAAANERSHRWSRSRPLIVVLIGSVRRATRDASAEKSCGPERSCSKRILTSSWEPLVGQHWGLSWGTPAGYPGDYHLCHKTCAFSRFRAAPSGWALR